MLTVITHAGGRGDFQGNALAARAGYTCQQTPVDDDSIDVRIGTLGFIHGRAVVRSPIMELQLEATQRGPGAATKRDQPHRDREGMCAITMPCVCSPMVATLTPCHKLGCKIVHSVQDFQN